MTFPINIKLARSWNELTDKQLEAVATALEYFHKLKDSSPKEQLPQLFSRLYLSLVKTLLRVNNPFKVWYALRQLPPEEYEQHLEYLLQGNKRTRFPKAFKIKKQLYHPPGDRINNISVKEFSFVDALFYRWRDLKDDRYLDLLCASLYRQSRGPLNEVDPRKEFFTNLVERDVLLWNKVPRRRKLAIAYAYEGSRNYLVAGHKNVFPPAPQLSEEEEEARKKNPPPKQPYVPFGKLISAKSEYKPHQLAEVENLNVYKFMGLFDNELSESKTIKRR